MADQNKNNSSAGFNPIGLCMGMGVGLCFCVALGRKPDESGKKQDEDKK